MAGKKREDKLHKYKGRKMTLAEVERELGLQYGLLSQRRKNNMHLTVQELINLKKNAKNLPR